MLKNINCKYYKKFITDLPLGSSDLFTHILLISTIKMEHKDIAKTDNRMETGAVAVCTREPFEIILTTNY